MALCSSSGSGKSTCVSLVQRFYDIQSGRVLVGGKDVRGDPHGSVANGDGLRAAGAAAVRDVHQR